MPESTELFYISTDEIQLDLTYNETEQSIYITSQKLQGDGEKTFFIFRETLSNDLSDNSSYTLQPQSEEGEKYSIVIRNSENQEQNAFKDEVFTLLFDSLRIGPVRLIQEESSDITDSDTKSDDDLDPKTKFLESGEILLTCRIIVPITITNAGDSIKIKFKENQSENCNALKNKLEKHKPIKSEKADRSTKNLYPIQVTDLKTHLSLIIKCPTEVDPHEFRRTVFYILRSLETTLSSPDNSSLYSCLEPLFGIDNDTYNPHESITDSDKNIINSAAEIIFKRGFEERKNPTEKQIEHLNNEMKWVEEYQEKETDAWAREHPHLIRFTLVGSIITAVSWSLKAAENINFPSLEITIILTTLTALLFLYCVSSYCTHRKHQKTVDVEKQDTKKHLKKNLSGEADSKHTGTTPIKKLLQSSLAVTLFDPSIKTPGTSEVPSNNPAAIFSHNLLDNTESIVTNTH